MTAPKQPERPTRPLTRAKTGLATAKTELAIPVPDRSRRPISRAGFRAPESGPTESVVESTTRQKRPKTP